ncbi:MAG: hypothetical protein IPJ66_20030 [Bacteroidetes bacterium]|nr:hypothetical protein [Bacteroidota bacterium]
MQQVHRRSLCVSSISTVVAVWVFLKDSVELVIPVHLRSSSWRLSIAGLDNMS